MTSGFAKVNAGRSDSPARGIAAAMNTKTSALQMTNAAWLAASVPTSKIHATLRCAFSRCIRNFLTTPDEGLVPTARQKPFDIELAFN